MMRTDNLRLGMKKKREKKKKSQFPSLIRCHGISQPMKLFRGDIFLFRGVNLKRLSHELQSLNTASLKPEDSCCKWVSSNLIIIYSVHALYW